MITLGGGKPYSCPYCGQVVADQVRVVVMPALRVFELHLDGHVERGDQLLHRVAS